MFCKLCFPPKVHEKGKVLSPVVIYVWHFILTFPHSREANHPPLGSDGVGGKWKMKWPNKGLVGATFCTGNEHTRMQLISIMYFPHYKFPGPSSSSSSHFTFPQSWFFNNKAPTAIYAHCSPEWRTGWTETSPGWRVVKWRESETGTDKSYLSIYA